MGIYITLDRYGSLSYKWLGMYVCNAWLARRDLDVPSDGAAGGADHGVVGFQSIS